MSERKISRLVRSAFEYGFSETSSDGIKENYDLGTAETLEEAKRKIQENISMYPGGPPATYWVVDSSGVVVYEQYA